MTCRHTLIIMLLLVGACSPDVTEPTTSASASTGPTTPVDTRAQAHPDVVAAELSEDDDGTFTAAVTLSSPYDSPERYADAWRVLSTDRQELGIRELTHDHAGEQPFTRSQSGIVIPADLTQVIIQGRDQTNGWGGAELTVDVPGR